MHVSSVQNGFGFIVSKEGNLLNPKKSCEIFNMPPPKTPKDIQEFNNMTQFYHVFILDFGCLWPQSLTF